MNKVQKNTKIETVPIELAGKWIAWSADHTRIVASGDHIADVSQEVTEKGEKDVWFDKVPSRTVFFGGAAFHG
ncbi:MAG: hypothetical protein AAB649_00605 [Patescibacteria group bacterium]